jgi:hypothetical protein
MVFIVSVFTDRKPTIANFVSINQLSTSLCNDKPIEKNIGYDGNKPHLLNITLVWLIWGHWFSLISKVKVNYSGQYCESCLHAVSQTLPALRTSNVSSLEVWRSTIHFFLLRFCFMQVYYLCLRCVFSTCLFAATCLSFCQNNHLLQTSEVCQIFQHDWHRCLKRQNMLIYVLTNCVTHTHTRAHARTYTCTRAHTRTYTHARTHTRMHARARTHIHTCTRAQTHTHMRARAHTHTHTHAQTDTRARTDTNTESGKIWWKWVIINCLCIFYTHTHTHTRTHERARTHTHTNTHKHTLTYCSHARTHTHTRRHITHTYTHTQTHTYTHINKQTHTNKRSEWL